MELFLIQICSLPKENVKAAKYTSLNFQYNVPKHVRNIYHIQLASVVSMLNLEYTEDHMAFCQDNKKVHLHSRFFKELLHKTFPNSMKDLKKQKQRQVPTFLEKQFQMPKRLRSLILSTPHCREFWGTPSPQNARVG